MAGRTRQSTRNQKLNSEQSVVNTGRSRSTSTNRSASQRRNVTSTSVTDKSPPRKRKRSVSSPVEAPKVFKRFIDGRTIDTYCWVCHKFGSDSICNLCPRVYHNDCRKKLKGTSSNSSLPCECSQESADGKTRYWIIEPRELKKLLQYVMQEAIKEEKKNKKSHQSENNKFCRLFQAWPLENDDLCKIIDLNILLDNMNGDSPYRNTGQFFLDVKYIHHNCCIIYGSDHEITHAALKLEKNFKQELTDMEACPECYYNKYSDRYILGDFFTKVCTKPHSVIWAKLRGSPFWPAKCLKIYNDHADVRFFGTHDKSNIPINKCYKISKDNPMNKIIQQAKYKDAIQELSVYVRNYESFVGPFRFYPPKTVLEKDNTSFKKSSKRGYHRLNNNPEQVDENMQNSDPKETKVKLFANFSGNEKNTNVAESVEGIDIDSNIVCQMTFTADEHDGPANELTNSEDIMDTSVSHSSLSEASIDPSISLSLNKTPGLVSGTFVLPSTSEIMTTTEAHQNSLNFFNDNVLPVITSVSAKSLNELSAISSAVSGNEISQSEISSGPSTSNSLPVITSAVSTSTREHFAEGETSGTQVNGQHSEDSSSSPSLSENLIDFMKSSSLNFLFEAGNEDDDDVQVISEGYHRKIDHRKDPKILQYVTDALLKSKPQLKQSFLNFHSVMLQYFLLMWIEVTFSKFNNRDVNIFFEILAKCVKKKDSLAKALSKTEEEKAVLEEDIKKAVEARKEAEKGQEELERAKAILEAKVQELTSDLENLKRENDQKQMSEIKALIIQKASQKIQRRHQNNEAAENNDLNEKLIDALSKVSIKEQEICNLRDDKERLESLLSSRKDIVSQNSEVQTEETNFGFSEREVLNQNQHSSQFTNNNLEMLSETCSSSQEQQNLPHGGMQTNMVIIETIQSVSSSNSTLNTVMQQVYEQNVSTSECATVMAATSTGMMNVPTPTLLSIPMSVVVPPNPIAPPPGPIFQDTESSATNLNSTNPQKSKAKPGKRKRKNV